MRKTLQCVIYDKASGVCPTSVPLSYIVMLISHYSVISCQRDQCVICDGWVEMRRRPFSPMCDAASSQLVVTTNDRPSIPICPIVHNTENIDRPLARDLTAKNILGRKKCPLTSINKCAPDRLLSLSVGCRCFSGIYNVIKCDSPW